MHGSNLRVVAAAIGLAVTLILSLALSAGAVEYYVSPSGNNVADGLTHETAWRSIDNGDDLGVLIPGDTVNILPGLYLVSSVISLISSGTYQLPIVYSGPDTSSARIRTVDGTGASITMQGSNLILRYLDISADPLMRLNGIQVDGDSCTVSGCVIRYTYYDGIEVNGSNNLTLKTS